MKTYTIKEILKAAELGEVSMTDAKHICSLLDEARDIICEDDYKLCRGKRVYEIASPTEDKIDDRRIGELVHNGRICGIYKNQ